MTKLPTFVVRVFFVVALVAAALAPAGAQQPPEPPAGFVSVDELPPEEQIPAAPLLIAAYSFVGLALFAYVISVARRLTAVQGDIERLETDLKKGRRA
jgi:CcmD family protein